MAAQLSDADVAMLASMEKQGDPRANIILKKMTPDELDAYMNARQPERQMGNDIGVSPTATVPAWLQALVGGGLTAGVVGAPAVAAAATDAAKTAWPYVKYGAGATAINYLPVPTPIKTALESMLGMRALLKGGGGGAAGAAEGASEAEVARAAGQPAGAAPKPPLNFKDMGGMTDEQVIAALKGGRQAPSRVLTTPEQGPSSPEAFRGWANDPPPSSGVRLRTPEVSPVQPPADIEQRTRPDWLTQDVAPGPFANPNAHVLRPDESLIGLIQERYPGLNVKGLKVPPVPEGADPLAKAIRQRKHIGDAVNRYSMPHGVTPTTDDIVQQLNAIMKSRK